MAIWPGGKRAITRCCAATEEELERKIRAAPVGQPQPQPPAPAPDELTPLRRKYPRHYIWRVKEGEKYLALPRGMYPLLADTLEELDRKLGLSK